MQKTLLAISLMTCCETGWSIELAPWYSRMFEIHPFITGLTQYSSSVQSSHGDFDRNLHANFLNGGVHVAAYNWAGEIDLSLAESSKRNFGFDSITFTGRYQIWDDVALIDPVSVVATLSFSSASRTAVNDIASFHHGKFKTIAHISVGKEFPCQQFWLSRFWSAVGAGFADVGSPWWHFYLCAEKNIFDRHRWMIFMESLVGCGSKSLSRKKSFHGYGPIAHRSVDFGINYRFSLECGLKVSLEYSYRVYAQNFPKNTNSAALSLLYPFGL